MAPGCGVLGWSSEYEAGGIWLALGPPQALMHETPGDPASNQPLSLWPWALRESLLAVLGEADGAGNEDALRFPGFRHLETL